MADRDDDAKPLTAKQEAFALAYVETGNAAESYRRAYDVAAEARDSWIYVEALQLLDHPRIGPRIAALKEQALRLAGYTIHKAAEEYEEARQLALKSGMPAAAVSAVSGKVKLFGLERQRIRHELTGKDGGPIQTIDPAKLSTSALAELLAARNAGPDE